MKNLVIVESPAKADTIEKFLGKEYTVKSSKGHIRDLQERKLSVDIEHGFTPEYVIPADKRKLVADLKKLAAQAETVWLASDEDREGEAISWHLFETLGLKKENTRRIAFHEITKTAILEAIDNPRDIDMNLVNAQQARRVLDRLVGFELSPVLWRKIQPKLSAGRVQSVALRLIVDREREILAFKREPFYRVDALFHPAGTPASVKVKATLEKRFPSLEETRKFLEDSIGARFTIQKVDKKEGLRVPAAPFTTSTLQQEAARKLHFPVGVTMRIAQQLYERGLITYMRTDSTNLSGLALATSKEFITAQFGAEYAKTRQYRTRTRGAQEAHEAIRPTYIAHTDIEGTAQEKRLYALIWKRTVASQMADAKVLRTDIRIASDRREEAFAVQAQEILFDGFLKVYMEGTDEAEGEEGEVILPEMAEGTVMEAKGITGECKFTAPPPRYSQGTLVKKLEELEIGRPSTWATTVETLSKGRGYLVTGDKDGQKVEVTNLSLKGSVIRESVKNEVVGGEKGRLLPQEVGMIVTDYLVEHFPTVLDYDFTANVEKGFDEVAEGRKAWESIISAFYGPFHERVHQVMEDRQFNHVERALGNDPADGLPLVARYGQYGPYIQKGEGETRQFARLAPGQLIESITLEEAVRLFDLPRTVGVHEGIPVIATKGRFGPYLKYGDRNISLPRGADPMTVSLEECAALIAKDAAQPATQTVLREYGDIQVIQGRYGLYLKHNGDNYRIPKGTKPEALTEAYCRELVAGGRPTGAHGRRKTSKS